MDELKKQLEFMQREIKELKDWKSARERQQLIAPLDNVSVALLRKSGTITVPQGGTGVTSLSGIVKGNGTSSFSAITPLSGTKVYYVSDSSGGAVTRKLTFTDGVLTSQT